MTLAVLKTHFKIVIIFGLILSYGTGAFFLGKLGLPDSLKSLKSSRENRLLESKVDKPIPASDVTSAKVIPASVKQCANATLGFEIVYPKDWFTTYSTEDQKCLYFAPYSFVIPISEDKPQVPIKIEVENPQNWAQALKFAQNPNDFQNIIKTESLDINSRPTNKVHAESTGQGYQAKGFKKLTYLVFDPARPLVLTYQQNDEKEDASQMEQILESMVSSLKFN